MNDLANVNAVIIVFAMPGCPACDEFKPRFEAEVERFRKAKYPFVWYGGRAVAPGTIPVLMLDASSPDPQVQALANQYGIEGVPATMLLTRTAYPVKTEGAVSTKEIYEMLESAVLANR